MCVVFFLAQLQYLTDLKIADMSRGHDDSRIPFPYIPIIPVMEFMT